MRAAHPRAYGHGRGYPPRVNAGYLVKTQALSASAAFA
jgi:hypothetical protein